MGKKNTFMKLCIIILCLIVLILGIYIINDKKINQEKESNLVKYNYTLKDRKNVQTLQKGYIEVLVKYNYTLKDRKNVQTLQKGYIEVLVDLNGEVYLSVIGNIDYIEDEQTKNHLTALNNNLEINNPKGYTDNTGQSSSYKSRKIDVSNVLTAYNVSIGNGGTDCFIFIKENGTLSYLLVNYTAGTLPIFDIEELDNIVSIVENNYTKTPYAIDINGNEFSLYDYINY